MKTNMRQTSLNAYYDLANSGKLSNSRGKVLSTILKHGSKTNLELSRIMNRPINSVTPRIKELRDLGVVVECGLKVDPITNKSGTIWGINLRGNDGEKENTISRTEEPIQQQLLQQEELQLWQDDGDALCKSRSDNRS